MPASGVPASSASRRSASACISGSSGTRSAPGQGAQVGEHLVGVRVDVRDPVGLPDHALGIDQVRPPLRRAGAALLGGPLRLVRLADGPILVGKEAERKAVPLGEPAGCPPRGGRETPNTPPPPPPTR